MAMIVALAVFLAPAWSYPTYIGCDFTVVTGKSKAGLNVMTTNAAVMGTAPTTPTVALASASSATFTAGSTVNITFSSVFSRGFVHATAGTLAAPQFGGGVQAQATVSCSFTIDNYVTTVRYNGVNLAVSGNLNDWKSPKEFSYTEISGAVLEIAGGDQGNCNGCRCAGLQLQCSNGFVSNTADWTAFGAASSSYPSGSTYATPCVSTSGFSLAGAPQGSTKIWAANGAKYAWFRAVPYTQAAATPSATACSGTESIKYKNTGGQPNPITWKAPSDVTALTSVTFSFASAGGFRSPFYRHTITLTKGAAAGTGSGTGTGITNGSIANTGLTGNRAPAYFAMGGSAVAALPIVALMAFNHVF